MFFCQLGQTTHSKSLFSLESTRTEQRAANGFRQTVPSSQLICHSATRFNPDTVNDSYFFSLRCTFWLQNGEPKIGQNTSIRGPSTEISDDRVNKIYPKLLTRQKFRSGLSDRGSLAYFRFNILYPKTRAVRLTENG